MKRFLVAALAVLAASSASTADLGASQPRARLQRFVCQPALEPAARAVSVRAVMRPLPGTKKMLLRFDLRSKSPGASYGAVSGGDLGTWIAPGDKTLGQRPRDVWILNKQVVDLPAPAAYRFRVSFRWTGAHERVLDTAVRDSPTCLQPELRPDLLVQSVDVQAIAGKPKWDRYVATIRNRGATAAGSFEVLFSPGGVLPVQARIVQGLRAHSSIQRTFVAPVSACTTMSAPTVTVDPNEQIDDQNRANNSLTAVCPGSSGQ